MFEEAKQPRTDHQQSAIDDFKALLEDQDAEALRHTALAWFETAMRFSRNEDYYRDLVYKSGELFGEPAFTSDDGSVQDSVIAPLVPELTAKMIERNVRMHSCLTTIANNPGWLDHHIRAAATIGLPTN